MIEPSEKIVSINNDGIIYKDGKKLGVMNYDGTILAKARFEEIEQYTGD